MSALSVLSCAFIGCGGGDDDDDATDAGPDGTAPHLDATAPGQDATTFDAASDATTPADTGTGSDTSTGSDTGTGSETGTDSGHDAGDAGDAAVADAGDAGTDAGDAGDSGAATALFRLVGRWDQVDANTLEASWPGSGIIATFTGTSLALSVTDLLGPQAGGDYLDIWIDNVKQPAAAPAAQPIVAGGMMVASGLAAGVHKIEIYKATDSSFGTVKLTLNGTVAGTPFSPGATYTIMPEVYSFAHRIEFIGDEQTAGYGDVAACSSAGGPTGQSGTPAANQFDENLAFPALIARHFNAEHITTAQTQMGVTEDNGTNTFDDAVNYWPRTLPLSDATATWTFSKFTPEVVVIDLGSETDFANASVVANPAAFETGLEAFFAQVFGEYPSASIISMSGPSYAGDNGPVDSANKAAVAAYLAAHAGAKIQSLIATPAADNSYFGCDYRPGLKEHQVVAAQLEAILKAAPFNWATP